MLPSRHSGQREGFFVFFRLEKTNPHCRQNAGVISTTYSRPADFRACSRCAAASFSEIPTSRDMSRIVTGRRVISSMISRRMVDPRSFGSFTTITHPKSCHIASRLDREWYSSRQVPNADHNNQSTSDPNPSITHHMHLFSPGFFQSILPPPVVESHPPILDLEIIRKDPFF